MLVELERKFQRTIQEYDTQLEQAFQTNSTSIINLIRQDQLFDRGVNADNEVIGTYSLTTEILSGGRKRAGDNYNFFDTGNVFRSFTSQLASDTFRVFPTDSKVSMLKREYGNNIFDFTEVNKNMIHPLYIEPYMIRFFNRIWR